MATGTSRNLGCLLVAGLVFSTYTCISSFSRETGTVEFAQNGAALGIRATATTWHLLSTSGPDGPIYSIMHTADPLRSDPDFAGMLVRCSSKLGLQAGFVLVVPLPPRAKPHVTVSASNAGSSKFDGSVLSPGTIVLITTGAEPLAQALMRSSDEVSVAIEGDRTFRGVVPLDDFGAALASLRAHCS